MNNQQSEQLNNNLDKAHNNTSQVSKQSDSVSLGNNKKKKTLKILCIILGSIATILTICVCAILIFNYVGKTAMHNYSDMTINEDIEEIDKVDSIKDYGKTIQYNGSTYAFNENVTSVVFMGIDTDESADSKKVVGSGGQADAIYIAVIDTEKKQVTILGVSRDTMVDVNVYNQDGGFVNTSTMQLCLSYAYGDGAHTSCENTIKSLERLFYGLQFDTYVSINENALKTLTDAINGVTLTVDKDFYSSYYGRTIYSGETVTLYGSDALFYTRTRNLDKLDSNNDRMVRQKQFMSAFIKKTFDEVKSNPTTVSNLYSAIKSNCTTNLNNSKMTYLVSSALSGLDSYKDIEFINLDGTVKEGEYAEFYPDEDSLMETMLELFYIKID